jgi:arginine decarboxylase
MYPELTICIVKGTGYGSTNVTAWDAALQRVGVHNYNIIALSSIIPPHSTIVEIDRYTTPEIDFGKRLYVVRAEIQSSVPGEWIAAGVGWYQFGDGRGFFVEQELVGESEEVVGVEVSRRLNNALTDMCNFRGMEYNPADFKYCVSVAGAKEGSIAWDFS